MTHSQTFSLFLSLFSPPHSPDIILSRRLLDSCVAQKENPLVMFFHVTVKRLSSSRSRSCQQSPAMIPLTCFWLVWGACKILSQKAGSNDLPVPADFFFFCHYLKPSLALIWDELIRPVFWAEESKRGFRRNGQRGRACVQEGEQRENKKEGGRNAGERRRMCTKKETEEEEERVKQRLRWLRVSQWEEIAW